MSKTNDPILVIVGETASGKTALAIELAQRFDGEIICADSSTVRREVNIGSAKPTIDERSMVPHHLLDVVGPDEPFSAAQFKELADKAIRDIRTRGKLPILVGGTGLYIDSVIYGYTFRDKADPALRQELNSLSRQELLNRIEQKKIPLGETDTHNQRRLIRLIESGGRPATSKRLQGNTFVLGLQNDREYLKERIAKRVDEQIAAGLEAEVRGLAERYGWGCEALKAIAYAQWKDYFEGTQNLQETRQKIIKANLSLAKRQRTWFKRNKSIHWFITPVNQTEVVDLLTTFLKS